MIKKIGTITIDQNIEYISDWKDDNGNFKFDTVLGNARMIVNKTATGCGFTTYCLANGENTILVSPRTWLIREKNRKFGNKCFYFNREICLQTKKQLSIEQLLVQLAEYIQTCREERWPIKIMVTYDSFNNLVDMLEGQLGIDIFNDFRIVIDEAQALIKDLTLKEYNNNCVLSRFLEKLFHYVRLLFVSATPLEKYLAEITQFIMYPVEYVEIMWPNIRPIDQRIHDCKNSSDAFCQIYENYSRQIDPYGNHYFDALFYGEGRAEYSYEAVIFLNSVLDIRRIVNKYVNKLQLIDIADITVICAKTKDNAQDLAKTHKNLMIADQIPDEGQSHTTWTFVTRTAFEGVDFNSSCASTFVIANYNVDTLSLDIASDLPQIVGRQRLKTNRFRDILHIYCKNSITGIDDESFAASQEKKRRDSLDQIAIYNQVDEQRKKLVVDNLTCVIESNPGQYYLKTINGKPELNNLIIISENYTHDILKNQIGLYVIPSTDDSITEYSLPVRELKESLSSVVGKKAFQDKIRITCEWLCAHNECQEEAFRMLCREGYSKIASYFNLLPLDRIIANGCDPWKIEQEMEVLQFNKSDCIKELIAEKFVSGQIYSKREVKDILQEIYDQMQLRKTAKSTDLADYISFSMTKKNGLKAYRII